MGIVKEKKKINESLFVQLKSKILNPVMDTKKNWWTKTAWRELLKDKDINKKLSEAVEKTRQFASIQKYDLPPKRTSGAFILRSITNMSENRVLGVKINKYLEEFLERLITVSCETLRIGNQYNLLSGFLPNQSRKSIDLVIADDKDRLIELIELKASNNKTDNPFSAAIEIILDFFILKEIKKGMLPIKEPTILVPDISPSIKLTVLAPKKYYSSFEAPKEVFSMFAKILSKAAEVEIEYQTINIEEKDLIKGLELGELKKNFEVRTEFEKRKAI